jgi:signal transduction histidine kinase
MSYADQRARYATVTAAARVFALIVLATPVVVTLRYGAVVNLILIAVVWMAATLAEQVRRVPVMPALVVEASLVTFLAAWMVPESTVLLPAIVIPQFIGGLVRGPRGALEVLGAEAAVLVATILPGPAVIDRELVGGLFTWLMVGQGFGLLTAIVHKNRSESDLASSYSDARRLITQLLDLSGELVDGLDPVSIGENILDLAREELPLTGATVYTRNAFGIMPLLEGDVFAHVVNNVEIADAVFATGESAVDGPWVALPLATDAGVVGVLVGGLAPTTRLPSAALHTALADLSHNLRAEALQLDTALLFSAVRDEATAEERRRLSRDLHDGVAQDMASLGYMIDAITDTADSPDVVQRCLELRGELSKVVAELRRSVFVLRNESRGATSLGESIRALAGHIETRSGIPVEVDLTEGATRLRPEVEAELLRITQEGMNNAVKHARATRIRVRCNVDAPFAEVLVTDNGRGLQTARDDSHGVRIMRERARRIGAVLDLTNAEGRAGAELRVVIDAASRSTGSVSPVEGTTA